MLSVPDQPDQDYGATDPDKQDAEDTDSAKSLIFDLILLP